MWRRIGRTGTALVAMAVVGVAIIGARAQSGTMPSTATSLRTGAQQLLDRRASLLSGPARIALGMIAVRGKYGQNLQNIRDILGDFGASKNVGEIHERANKRRPRWHRLPYGVPLCIGFVGYLIYLNSL